MAEQDTPVHLDVADRIAVVTLNLPPVNATNMAMRLRLLEIFDEVHDRDDVQVVILTAAGKAFCAGADLKSRPDIGKPGQLPLHNRVAREVGDAIRYCAKPVIAAVNGPALGAGFVLVAACDIMVAAEEAVFGMPEIDVGLPGGVAALEGLLGRSVMRRMVYTGMRLSAQELYRRGVIESVVAREQLMPEAMGIARQIAAKSPVALKFAKKACNYVNLMPAMDKFRFEQTFVYDSFKSDDAREALAAFAEKRPPVFTGR